MRPLGAALLSAGAAADWTAFDAAPADERRAVVAELKAELDARVRSRPGEAPALADLLVRAARDLPELTAIALRGRALAAHFTGRSADALPDYRRACALHEQAGEEVEAARVRRTLVDVLALLGQNAEALAEGELARGALLRHGETRLLAQLDVNIGNVLVRLDDYAGARQRHESARAAFATLGDSVGEAFAAFNLGVVELNANRLSAAEAALLAAREGLTAAGMELHVADCDYILAYMLARRGRFADAVAGLQECRARYERCGKASGPALCDLDLAEIHLRLDARRDALRHARAAAAVFAQLGMPYERARAQSIEGLALAGSGDLGAAQLALDAAESAFAEQGNQAFAAAARLQRSALAVRAGSAVGDTPGLVASLREQRERLRSSGLALLADLAGVTLARALLAAGEVDAALAELSPLLQRGERDADQDDLVLADAHALAGDVHARRSDPQAAIDARRRAVELIERSWASAPGRDVRMAFFRDRSSVYLDLAWDLAQQGRTGEALVALEQGRGRSLLEAVEAAREESPELAAARARLDWLLARRLDRELGPTGGPTELRRLGAADADLAAARRELSEGLLAQRATRGRDPAAPPELQELLSARRADERLLVYLVTRAGLRALLIDDDGVSDVPLHVSAAALQVLRDRLLLHVDRPRLGAEWNARHADRLALVERALFAEFGARLLAPLADRLRDGRPLVIVPCGPLHDLPFHAFELDGEPLIARCHVSYAAGVRELAATRSRPLPEVRGPLLLTGVEHAALPAVLHEVEALARAHKGAVERVPAADLPARLACDPPRGALLHLAGHGHFEPQAPLFSAVSLGPRCLYAHDIERLELDFALVVLSGCETGRRRRIAGEELLGLSSAWLRAGARAVLGSLWPVEDETTRAFMLEFHAELAAGASARGALAAVQRRAGAAGRSAVGWGAFALHGDGAVQFADTHEARNGLPGVGSGGRAFRRSPDPEKNR